MAAKPATAIEAGINIDVHQDIQPSMPPFQQPNGFHVFGRIESGVPLGNWNSPPGLVDHVDDMFPFFNYTIQPDFSDPGQNWYLFDADWSFPFGDPGLPYCVEIHLGLLFDVSCHNVVIDLQGSWTVDGQPIFDGLNQGFRWWGSYFDQRYLPEFGGEPPHVLDGWLISFHWAEVNANPDCPPDLLSDPPPTVLGIYFAPADAVEFLPLIYTDCLGHPVYEYIVDLDRCCLVCAHMDPRVPDGTIPAQPDAFYERHPQRYWLDIQAVTGARWVPGAVPGECVFEFTGHLPSDMPENEGHFWGWHSSPDRQLSEACTGRIVDFTPYPPNCWDYGNWIKQPWLCPGPPKMVDMSFELLTTTLPGDCDDDDVISLSDYAVLYYCLTGPDAGPIGAGCPCIDLDVDDDVDLADFALFMNMFPTP